jgi:hypothetical protein
MSVFMFSSCNPVFFLLVVEVSSTSLCCTAHCIEIEIKIVLQQFRQARPALV